MSIDRTEAAHLANFVQFAYNMFDNQHHEILEPTPDPGIAVAGYQLTYWLTAKDFEEQIFYGYIAESTTSPGDIVLAIRGTEDASEWILNFAALPVLFHAHPLAGFVTLGFQTIQQSFMFTDDQGVSSSVADVVNLIADRVPITRITVLGHSLGGALATLTAAELAARNPSNVKDAIRAMTFASPRTGLLDFADWFNHNVPASNRVWNILDVVPQVPPFPYIHVNDLGDCIIQTEQQLQTLQKLPVCEHRLKNYQWLLDSPNFALTPDCEIDEVDQEVANAGAAAIHSASHKA